ncbi:hypothetical protein BG015_003327 [Linnemannia schmuckeri]|uniref:Uncharacterized protein n=1 Tax=Linnemannia schmuckeri TaxID=64567 RepID=A0A9P5V4T0_9FUNG|nr:hypothetical protein BG015_003327 [Linnemannia schmuckeri]
MAAVSEKYQQQATLPFSSEELGDFHRFHAHPWDTDDQFQAGLRTITQSQAMEPSFSELLKMKQYYFSTRMNVRINLDDYLSWRKHLEQPSDDPNVPIFKRFDEYNFDTDRKFQQGLPSIIGQLVKDGKSTLDKAALQKEMTKAKAFYYARFIELFDFPAYLAWKEMEKSQAGPACPYAHLWQNKGKGSGNELEEDAQKFLTATQPLSTGALQVHIHSPATKNSFTGVRLAKASQAITEAKTKESITSVYWTANSGKSTQNERDPESEIVTKDEKWFSGGVVVGAPSENTDSKQDPVQIKERLRQYYSLVDQMNTIDDEQDKPVVRIVDGIVSLSAAYLAFGAAGQRVITENATLSFTPTSTAEATNIVNNRFAGLYLLTQIQANAKNDTSARPLPKGVALYLAFCPDYILRGPDLRKLGLADFFISSSKKKDIDEAIVSVAGCPPPHTTQAIRMALNAEVVYPGPAKIDVWRSEIQECFDDATSLKDIISKLEKYNNNWSKSIRTYIASLEPVYAELLFKAIGKTAELTSFKECVQLEYRLAQRYREFEASVEEDKTTKALADLEDFFIPLETEEADLFNFDFVAYLKEHQEDKELADGASISAAGQENGADATQACPYLAGKVTANGDSAVPSDHPKIPGVDFSDPEAVKACPYLASKNGDEEKKEAAAPPLADHPSILGVDFSDPEAMKACPFLSAKNKRGEAESTAAKAKEESSALPSDHPVIPGVDFSSPDAIKACPFLSSQQQQQA